MRVMRTRRFYEHLRSGHAGVPGEEEDHEEDNEEDDGYGKLGALSFPPHDLTE